MCFLWSLLLLKSYNTENNTTAGIPAHVTRKCSKNRHSYLLQNYQINWVKLLVQQSKQFFSLISSTLSLIPYFVFNYYLFSFFLLYKKIIWENCYVDDIGNDCLASVDGTDSCFAWVSSDFRLLFIQIQGSWFAIQSGTLLKYW